MKTEPPDAAPDPVRRFETLRTEQARARRGREILFGLLFVAALLASGYVGEVRIDQFIDGLPGLFNYINDTLPPLNWADPVGGIREWYWAFPRWFGLLLDTILIAALGTLLGCIGALVLCFAASRNLMQNGTIYFITRRVTEVARAVPELVYALIFVFAFGLGPLPGVLAIAVHTSGALGKLFSEVNENIDMKVVEGIRASGGNWFHIVRFAVIPQVLPNFLSYVLLRFEINVRSASIVGFVGAGGIGQELMFVIRQFVYTDISALVLMIVVTVALIDIGCEALRHRTIGQVAPA